MKKPLLTIISIFFIRVCNAQLGSFDYFCQTPPGNIPAVFSRGVISVEGSIEKSIAISPSGDEIFFMRGSGWPHSKIMHMVKTAGKWSMPDTAFFSKDSWATEPAFSSDGQYLYFSSSRGKSDIRFYNLWRIKKNKGGWSEPESIIDIAGEDIMEFHPSIPKNGSVYFCLWDYAKQIGDIYLSENIMGKLAAPVKVGFPISTEYNDTDPYVDEAETYMIFKSNRPGGYGDNDVYISFKKNDGTWTNPKNLGSSFNTPNNENPIDVSPDGKYMFIYLNNDMYWMGIDNMIDSLRNVINPADRQ
jgi:hypothetical protein